MYDIQHLENINKLFNIDEGIITNMFFNEIKESRNLTKPVLNNKKRPRWSRDTRPEPEMPLICSWPIGTNDSNICRCIECDKDTELSIEKYKLFKNTLLNLTTSDELLQFINNNKKYLSLMMETLLYVIRTEVIYKKWNTAVIPLIAVSKFKKNIIKNNDIS